MIDLTNCYHVSASIQVIYALLNITLFSLLQNCPYVNNGSRTVAGNVFHMDGPSNAKAREPNDFVLVRRCHKSPMIHLILVISHIAIAIPPHLSPSSPITCGVLQGSVLGPILFNRYTTPCSSLIGSSPSHTYYMPMTHNFSYPSSKKIFR